MPKQMGVLRAGEYFIAVQGLAMMRHLLTDPAIAKDRMDEVRTIIERFEEFPQTLEFAVYEYDVEPGYTQWAASYDQPNPAIEREEPIVMPLIAGLPRGTALDAACGTGRHARTLAGLGYEVIGVDSTPAMLDIAREKLPDADFRIGHLEALPVADASIDLITCALALTHVPALEPVMQEFARVLRPAGHAVLSDMHPFMAMTSGVAAFPAAAGDLAIPFVKNIVHQISEYVRAFRAAGLTVVECLEPTVTEEMLPRFPTYRAYPEGTRAAFVDAPYLLIWHLSR